MGRRRLISLLNGKNRLSPLSNIKCVPCKRHLFFKVLTKHDRRNVYPRKLLFTEGGRYRSRIRRWLWLRFVRFDGPYVCISVYSIFWTDVFIIMSNQCQIDGTHVRWERVYLDVACGAVVQILSFYFLFRIFNHFYLSNHNVIWNILYIWIPEAKSFSTRPNLDAFQSCFNFNISNDWN